MKLGRILGVVLSVGLALFFTEKYISEGNLNENINNSFGFANSNGVISDSSIDYENVTLDNEKTRNTEELTYTNKTSHTVVLNSNSISIKCNGENKEDEDIVLKGMKVKAYFSKSIDGDKKTSLKVESGEKAYIFITSSYESDVYPTSVVTCNYGVSIGAA